MFEKSIHLTHTKEDIPENIDINLLNELSKTTAVRFSIEKK
jgi:hypothetical protein